MFSTGKTTSKRLHFLLGDYLENSFCLKIYAPADLCKTGHFADFFTFLQENSY